jgi:hypothetical protein
MEKIIKSKEKFMKYAGSFFMLALSNYDFFYLMRIFDETFEMDLGSKLMVWINGVVGK